MEDKKLPKKLKFIDLTLSYRLIKFHFQVYNDFALLHLTEEFVLKNHLDTICLPQTPNDLGEEFDTRGCFATG